MRSGNDAGSTDALVQAAALFFQRRSGCEAVGIRLKRGDDYPYWEARGFSNEIVLLENGLCRRDAAGNVVRDCGCAPALECLCGNVICGRIDPGSPSFTSRGSFCSSSDVRPWRSREPWLLARLGQGFAADIF